MKTVFVAMILLLAVIPSLAFATTHQETFPTFYTNQTIFKGDQINVTNPTNLSYQVDGDGFGSGSIGQNGSVLFSFNKLGSFAVLDDLHRNLFSFINVIDPTLTPVIFTNHTSYNQGDIVDIQGINLIPVSSQTITLFDSSGNVAQVMNTPIMQDRSLFLPVIIPSLATPGEWKIVLVQNGQVITNSFLVNQSLQQAKNNDTSLSSPSIPIVTKTNSTISNSTANNSTITNNTVSVIQSNPVITDNSQQITDLTKKVDALTDKLNSMSTEQDSIFGLLTKIATFFKIN